MYHLIATLPLLHQSDSYPSQSRATQSREELSFQIDCRVHPFQIKRTQPQSLTWIHVSEQQENSTLMNTQVNFLMAGGLSLQGLS